MIHKKIGLTAFLRVALPLMVALQVLLPSAVPLATADSASPGQSAVGGGSLEAAAVAPDSSAIAAAAVVTPTMRQMVTNADRKAAAQRAAAARAAAGLSAQAGPQPVPGGTPDYFGTFPNYANSPQALVNINVTLAGGGASVPATAQANVGGLLGFTLSAGGSGYTTPPTVMVTGGAGFGATGVATIAGGVVTSITLTSAGELYSFAPTVVITGGGGTGAAATGLIAPGQVTSIDVVDGGVGYTSAPTVTITGSGTGATAVAGILNGAVNVITVTTPGAGYGLKVDSTGKIIGLRKFVDALPGLGPTTANDIGQYIPVAFADTTTYSNTVVNSVTTGSDYYEIGLVQYTEQLHKDLPPTLLRGYVQIETSVNVTVSQHIPLSYTTGAPILNSLGQQVYGVNKPQYLGPIILAQSNRPTRIKFTNYLPTGAGGNLFIPTDVTAMGAGNGPQGEVTHIEVTAAGSGYTSAPQVTITGGGGVGAMAIARILNGKVNGIQVTNVGAGYSTTPTVTLSGGGGAGATATASYAGEVGGLYTQNRATVHLHGGNTPWISDGTPHQWTTPAGETTPYPEGVSVYNVPDMPDPGPGSLTFFYTNQQSARLMFYHDHAYGITRLNVYAGEAAGYLVSDPIEQILVNGGTIPSTTVTVPTGTIPVDQIPLIIQDKTFVDASTIPAQDPTWNWGATPGVAHTGDLWFPHVYMTNQNPFDMSGINAMGRWDYGPWFWPPYTGLQYGPVTNPYASFPNEPPQIPGIPNPSMVPEGFMDTPMVNGTVYPYVVVQPKAYRLRILNAANDRSWNLQLYQAASSSPMWNLTTGQLLDPAAGEVPMVPAVHTPGYPATWPSDGRDGGVPSPAARGPQMIQIGTEGGLLPAPVVLPNQPIDYNYNRRDIVVLNVSSKNLFLGPAERADVIVDFSQFAGKTLILYNDAPAPVPAFDPRYDYYTGDPDQSPQGGAPTTLPGYGPNTRTLMQIQVAAATPVTYTNMAALNTAIPAAFAASQPQIIIPQTAYNAVYSATFPSDAYVRIQDTTATFKPLGASTAITMDLQPKAIQELFTPDYGRMNATLGVELPNTNNQIQTTIPLGYIDPPTEVITQTLSSVPITQIGTLADGTQIWKITHNGVDTHAIHFHMFNVQLINRVGWDGAIRPPDANEIGWKDTVRMNPLEDAIVALRPITPKLPFKIGNSIRPLDVTSSLGSTMGFAGIDPTNNNPVPVVNEMVNFGWEYVWHCHLLGHEENDMMRPILYAIPPDAPTNLVGTMLTGPARVQLTWTNPAVNATNFIIQRASNAGFTANLVTFTTNGPVTTYTDNTLVTGTAYYYRVMALNLVGSTAQGYPNVPATSAPSNAVSFGAPATPTNVTATKTGAAPIRVTVQWTNPGGATNFSVQRRVGTGGTWVTLSTTVAGTATSYVDTRAQAGVTYYYRVIATNAMGSSAPSAPSNPVTP